MIREFGTPQIPCYREERVSSSYIKLLTMSLNLGAGEAEVIAMATETGLGVIIDDLKARVVAQTLALRLTGTIGVLLKAEDQGLIESAEKMVRQLRKRGFYVSDEILKNLKRSRRGGN